MVPVVGQTAASSCVHREERDGVVECIPRLGSTVVALFPGGREVWPSPYFSIKFLGERFQVRELLPVVEFEYFAKVKIPTIPHGVFRLLAK